MSDNQTTGIWGYPSEYVLGIDLGTTNSSVSVYGPQGMDVINIPEEGLSMPSVVRFPDRRNDDLQVGGLAKRWIVSKPDEVFSSFKTQMASSEWMLDPLVKEKYTIEGEELDPTFMATQVLIKIREAVQQHPVYGKAGTICKAVICVPAQSQSTYVENVYRAAKAAGFGTWDIETGEKEYNDKGRIKGVTILEEPTAAAIAYGLMDNFFGGERNRKQKILIYDFGGGTFDVTLLEVTSSVGKSMPTFELINKVGDSKLGGDNLDWSLVDLLSTKLSKFAGFDVLSGEESLKTKAILKTWAEEAKKEFSNGAAEYEFEKDMTIGDESYDFSEKISKNDFLGVVQPIIDKTIDILLSVVKESNTDLDDINRTVLVGGSSKGYWVYNTVKDKLGRDPYFAPNVDTFVSAGASYYGANIVEGTARLAPVLREGEKQHFRRDELVAALHRLLLREVEEVHEVARDLHVAARARNLRQALDGRVHFARQALDVHARTFKKAPARTFTVGEHSRQNVHRLDDLVVMSKRERLGLAQRFLEFSR